MRWEISTRCSTTRETSRCGERRDASRTGGLPAESRCTERMRQFARSPTSSYDLRFGGSYEVEPHSPVHSSYATRCFSSSECSNKIQVHSESTGTGCEVRSGHEDHSGSEHAHRSEFRNE